MDYAVCCLPDEPAFLSCRGPGDHALKKVMGTVALFWVNDQLLLQDKKCRFIWSMMVLRQFRKWLLRITNFTFRSQRNIWSWLQFITLFHALEYVIKSYQSLWFKDKKCYLWFSATFLIDRNMEFILLAREWSRQSFDISSNKRKCYVTRC